MTEIAAWAVRVSHYKSTLKSDSPEKLKEEVQFFAKQNDFVLSEKFAFEFVQSATGELEMQPLLKAVEKLKKVEASERPKFFIIPFIERFSRGGAVVYFYLKEQLAKLGMQLLDARGTISTKTVNTLAQYNLEYSWSRKSPSRTSELLEAEKAYDDFVDTQTKLLGAQIRYERMGYWVKGRIHGYETERRQTENGARLFLKPHSVESLWYVRMFENRLNGLSDAENVADVNLMGYKTKEFTRHDKNDITKIVGLGGGKPLTIKKLQEKIANPIYAGIKIGRWTDGQVIKEKFDGLVTVDIFNLANQGKVYIHKDGDVYKIYRNKPPQWQLKKDKENPEYPFKSYVMCPYCNRPFWGSASKGKSGGHFAAYHCSRGHKYYRIKIDTFHTTIKKFLKSIKIKDDDALRFKKMLLEEAFNLQDVVVSDKLTYEKRIVAITEEQQGIKTTLRASTSPTVIAMLNEDVEKLQAEKVQLMVQRDKKEDQEFELEIAINKATYLLEHPEELIFGGSNPIQSAAFFGVLFTETPTYQDLIAGTPKLEPFVELIKQRHLSNFQMAG